AEERQDRFGQGARPDRGEERVGEHEEGGRQASHATAEQPADEVDQHSYADRERKDRAPRGRQQAWGRNIACLSVVDTGAQAIVAAVELVRLPALEPESKSDEVPRDGWMRQDDVVGLPGRA